MIVHGKLRFGYSRELCLTAFYKPESHLCHVIEDTVPGNISRVDASQMVMYTKSGNAKTQLSSNIYDNYSSILLDIQQHKPFYPMIYIPETMIKREHRYPAWISRCVYFLLYHGGQSVHKSAFLGPTVLALLYPKWLITSSRGQLRWTTEPNLSVCLVYNITEQVDFSTLGSEPCPRIIDLLFISP